MAWETSCVWDLMRVTIRLRFGYSGIAASSFVFIFLCLLSGCGSKGGEENTSRYDISGLPASIDLKLSVGQVHSETLELEFNGDSLFVRVPEGAISPSWLDGVPEGGTREIFDSPAIVGIGILATVAEPGTYQAQVQFVTGSEDTGEYFSRNVPVSLEVVPALKFLTESNSELHFESVNGQPSQSENIYITGGVLGTEWSLEVEYSTNEDWLEISQMHGIVGVSNTAISIRPKLLPKGNYSAIVRLYDSYKRYTGQALYVNYRHTYNIGLSVINSFEEITPESSIENMHLKLSVDSNNVPNSETYLWSISVDRDWLIPDISSGSILEMQTLDFTIDLNALNLELESTIGSGALYATISITEESGLVEPITHNVRLEYIKDLQLYITGDLYFLIDQNSTATDGVLTIETADNGMLSRSINWQAESNQSWFQLLSSEGSSTALENQLYFNIDVSDISIINESDLAVAITPENEYLDVTVVYPNVVVEIPRLTSVTPRILFEGRPSPIKVIGDGFKTSQKYWFTIGDTQVEGVAESNSLVNVELPAALIAGPTSLKVGNYLGLDLTSVDLMIKDVPSYQNKRWDLSHFFQSMVYDPWRSSMYFYGEGMRKLSYVELTDDIAPQSVEVPYAIKDVLMSKSGDSIAILEDQGDHLAVTWLDPNSYNLQRNAVKFSSVAGGSTARLMQLVDGQLYVYSAGLLSFFDNVMGDRELQLPELNLKGILQSSDGSIVIDAEQFSEKIETLAEWNHGQIFQVNHEDLDFSVSQASLSHDASILLSGGRLYRQAADNKMEFHGQLVFDHEINLVSLSPSGTYAYVQYYEGDQALVYRYHLTGDIAREVYPADSEPLATTIAKGEEVLQMIVSDDGGALFVLCLSADQTHSVFYTIPL